VDLGNSIGQQFTPITTLGGESTVNVYINSETRRLQFFKVSQRVMNSYQCGRRFLFTCCLAAVSARLRICQ
jgi:hypothetical protein